MPHAIKEQAEKGKDGLTCLLLERQNLPAAEIPGFMAQRFPKNQCLVSSDSWFEPAGWKAAGGGLPYACLIGVDGTMIWEGRPNGAPKKIEELIDIEIKKIKAGWGKTPEIKKARAAMHSKHNLGEAATILAAAEANIKEDAKTDFDAAKAELETIYTSQKKGIDQMLTDGRAHDAEQLAKDLAKSVKGKTEWEAELKTTLEDFAKPEVQNEVKLAAAADKLFHANGEKAPNADIGKKLRAFAKKNENAKAAGYALKLADAAEYKPH